MTESAANDWSAANQRYLTAAVDVVRVALLARARVVSGQDNPLAEALAAVESVFDWPGRRAAQDAAAAREALAEAAASMPLPAALDALVTTLGLTDFERDVLLVCAGVELDARIAPLCGIAQGDPARPYPTFGLLLDALAEPHWSAITPDGRLRHWRLIEVGAGPSLTLCPLRIDESVLHYLTGTPHRDERLAGFVEPLPEHDEAVDGTQPPSRLQLAASVARVWTTATVATIVQLCGVDPASKRAVATTACATLGLQLSVLPAGLLPSSPADLDLLARLWEREAALTRSALLIDCDDVDPADTGRHGALARVLERTGGPLIVSSRERRSVPYRLVISFDVEKPPVVEQRAIWRRALGDDPNTDVNALVAQFDLSETAIESAALAASVSQVSAWDACRRQARPRLDDLAQRIEPFATWDELVLPEPQAAMLHDIVAQVRQRATVYEEWGFAERSARGLGISALFVGSSGTGKTMAAEVLARALRLDLYRVDLSSVVSKYIGETEKNLRRVFDAAEDGGAVLLFDEADALFGRRSEVKDSHDRYANIEVSYLLQRMEAYRGLAILTTNMKSALDTAFLRRIRFVVQFPFPDAAHRTEIWRHIFPPATPTTTLDVHKLAQLNVAGGNIRNIALNAAFLAADFGEPVDMELILRAARTEYAKLDRALTDAEVAGWVAK